jgi:hypothetical protein
VVVTDIFDPVTEVILIDRSGEATAPRSTGSNSGARAALST